MLGLLSLTMSPIYFTVHTDRSLAIHAEELVLAFLMIMTRSKITRLVCNFDPHMLLEHLLILPLMHLFVTVIAQIDIIIFAVESSLLST